MWKHASVASIRSAAEAISGATDQLIATLSSTSQSHSAHSIITMIVNGPWTKTNVLNGQAKFLSMVHPDEAVRAAAEDARLVISQCKRRFHQNEAVYGAVSRALQGCLARLQGNDDFFDVVSPPDADLPMAIFARGILGKFHALGSFHIDRERRERAAKIQAELAEVEAEWKANLEAGVRAARLLFDPDQLAGVPESVVSGLDREEGKSVITLAYPHVNAVLQFCSVRDTRRQVWAAFRARGGEANERLMVRAGLLRKELAGLQGKSSFADVVLERSRMAGSKARVDKFLADLDAQTRVSAEKEMAQVRAFAKDKLAIDHLEPWDSSWVQTQMKQALFTLDLKMVNEHFPSAHVVPEVMRIYEQLFGMTFSRVDTDDVWHKDVEVWQARDSASGADLGKIYLDLWPRPGKYGHACVCKIVTAPIGPAVTPSQECCAMLCNLSDKMTHSDVITFLHELGHVIHDLAMAPGASSSYAKVPRDFVEAPSQFLENWGYEPSILARLSRHVVTGAPLPEDAVNKLRETRHWLGSLAVRRQLLFNAVDQLIHGDSPPTDPAQLAEAEVRFQKELCFWDLPSEFRGYSSLARNFGHTMSQYSASYYGYLYSEVFSADMFATRVKATSALTSFEEMGKDYRRAILAPGGIIKADLLLKTFLGREPSTEAFAKQF